MDTLHYGTPFNHDGDDFPSLLAADPKEWDKKGGILGTKASYIAPACDTTGFGDDSVTGDADVSF